MKKEVDMAPLSSPWGPGQNTCDKSSLNRETYKRNLYEHELFYLDYKMPKIFITLLEMSSHFRLDI